MNRVTFQVSEKLCEQPEILIYGDNEQMDLKSITEQEHKIYKWLEENNVVMTSPIEKMIAYFENNRRKISVLKKKTQCNLLERRKKSLGVKSEEENTQDNKQDLQ